MTPIRKKLIEVALPPSAFPVEPDFGAASFCTMATRNGKIKRVELSEFEAVRPSGLVAITLEEGDVLGWVRVTTGSQEIILVTEKGQALRYSEKLVRPMGRQATGVNAIRRAKDDFVTAMEVVDEESDLLVATFKGYGKRTPIREYSPKGRATGGVATIAPKTLDVTGRIAAARMVRADDDLTVGGDVRIHLGAVRDEFLLFGCRVRPAHESRVLDKHATALG